MSSFYYLIRCVTKVTALYTSLFPFSWDLPKFDRTLLCIRICIIVMYFTFFPVFFNVRLWTTNNMSWFEMKLNTLKLSLEN